MTYKEAVYYVLDALKFISDDSHFSEEHVLFLLDKYRSFIISQRYKDIRKEIPDSNYQTICVGLEEVNNVAGISCTNGHYLKSVEKIPHMMTVGSQKVTTLDFFQGNINYVNNDRFKYTGYNKYLKNQVYATIAPDQHLYIKSNNPQTYYLKRIKITGIFEDSTKLTDLQCDDNGDTKACDILDMVFPLEEALVPPVIELIVKELSAFKYQSADEKNNANDDLSDLAAYIRNQIANGRRSDLYKDYA